MKLHGVTEKEGAKVKVFLTSGESMMVNDVFQVQRLSDPAGSWTCVLMVDNDGAEIASFNNIGIFGWKVVD